MKVTRFHSQTTPYRIQLPGRYSPDGKRKSKYFRTLGEAEKFLAHVKRFGLPKPEIPKLTPMVSDHLRVVIDDILMSLGGDPATLYAARDHYVKTRLNIKAATLGQAIEIYLSYRAGRAKERTVKTISLGLHKLAHQIAPEVQLAHITDDMIRLAIDAQSKGNQRTVYKTLNRFFGWALEYKYLGENPMANFSPIGEFGINNEFYSVDTFARMLRIAAGLEPVKARGEITRRFINLLPVFVLGGLAGLRTCEIMFCSNTSEVVRWTECHWDAEFPCLRIRNEVAKGGHERHVDAPQVIEALKTWLPLCPKSGPYICTLTERTIGHIKKDFAAATGIKFEPNGLRNSFATYALAYSSLSGLGNVSRQMGNSEAICRRHYAQSLPTGSGKAWFAIRPFQAVQSEVA